MGFVYQKLLLTKNFPFFNLPISKIYIFLISIVLSQDTRFEENFIRELKKKTRRQFARNVHLIKGKPDIEFAKTKVCVFLDSDFWRNKIEKNRTRDRNTTAYLRRNGWRVLRIWEHSIKDNIALQIDKIIAMF